MKREELLKTLGFISTVVIPVLTLAVTSTLTYLKETTDKTGGGGKLIDIVD